MLKNIGQERGQDQKVANNVLAPMINQDLQTELDDPVIAEFNEQAKQIENVKKEKEIKNFFNQN